MIRNVIFDFGQVLVRFEPDYMVSVYVSDSEDKALLAEVVFDRLYWNDLDSGALGHDEAFERMRERLPRRLWEVARRIYDDWVVNLPEIEGMRDLILQIKRRYGASCFVLSDISIYFAENSHRVPILSLVDGAVFSGNIGITKPDRRIYEHILDKFKLDPAETVFIDDKPGNIAGAEAAGIKGYVFDGDSTRLMEWLEREMGA